MVSKPFSRPYSNTYNAGWRNHPNFSWRGEHNNVPVAPIVGPANFAAYGAHPGPSYVPHPSQSSQFSTQPAQTPKKGLEDTVQQLSVTLQQFMQGQATLNNQNLLAITDIRISLTRLTTSLSTQEKGTFPAQSQPNPQGQHHQVQVRINIPLLDVIQQIPTYAKFLKDLCTVKRRLNVHKKDFLTEQVSAIIQSNTPHKYKDPGAPTIACVIGNSKIGHALLDLGSSVNLLPYTVYEQLGLGELKSTPIILQLADRSIKMPRGIVEDVLVQVDKFYYHVDFVVLDMKLSTPSTFQAPVILGTGHGVLWQPKFDELPPLTAPIKPSSDVIPDLDLKPLSAGFK
ncbi:uncharacterized protein LOC108985606 [Juglans regia]|uniref:Uncharacterized protein LOC108985606 n=1 Tax=Juglans regia TaxID=51240 RepID=A0A6P9F5D0_JUGRE|nr:uncharacterized protein LOC108985606 [Juglans regia]